MKSKLLACILFIGLIAACLGEDKKETKDKRQIHHTRVIPQDQSDVSRQIESLYGAQPSQYLVRAVGQQQQNLQQHQQIQQQQQPEQAQEASPEHYAYLHEIQQVQQQKQSPYSKVPTKTNYPIRSQQYTTQQDVQYSQQRQPIQLISEDHLLKLLQDELASRGISDLDTKSPQQKPIAQKLQQNPGLGNYRDTPKYENPEQYNTYVPQNINQQYFSQSPVIDYHKTIPNHPLAETSLEKELEKLIASNKPATSNPSQYQPEPYKAPKLQQKAYASTPAPTIKPFSFLPDFAQFSAFKPQSSGFVQQPQYNQQNRHYSAENSQQQQQKISKTDQNNGQYLTEIVAKSKSKLNHTPFQQQKSTPFYLSEENQRNINNDIKNGAVRIIPAPSLQFERPQSNPSYYKNQNIEKAEESQRIEPSRSSIYVSQGTGLQPTSASALHTKIYGNEQKAVRLPPQDGKPISQEEFQALIDAGYAVTAIPVPVPVPYEKYTRDHPEYQQQSSEDGSKTLRQTKAIGRHGGITYLHPLQDVRQTSKNSS